MSSRCDSLSLEYRFQFCDFSHTFWGERTLTRILLYPKLPNLAARVSWGRTVWRKEIDGEKMSQYRLGELSGTTRDAIQKIEAGKTLFPRNIMGIGKALDLPPAWLMFGAEQIDKLSERILEAAFALHDMPEEQQNAMIDHILKMAAQSKPSD